MWLATGWLLEQRPRPDQQDCNASRAPCLLGEIADPLSSFSCAVRSVRESAFVTCRDRDLGFYSTFQLRGQSR